MSQSNIPNAGQVINMRELEFCFYFMFFIKSQAYRALTYVGKEEDLQNKGPRKALMAHYTHPKYAQLHLQLQSLFLEL